MFGEMKAACLLQNAVRRSASAMTAPTALEMATIAGAKAIGRAKDLGSIEPGKLADIVLLDLDHAHTTPVHNVVSNIVFATNAHNVDTVLIGGRIVLRNGVMQGLDEGAVIGHAQRRAEEIRVRLGLSDMQSCLDLIRKSCRDGPRRRADVRSGLLAAALSCLYPSHRNVALHTHPAALPSGCSFAEGERSRLAFDPSWHRLDCFAPIAAIQTWCFTFLKADAHVRELHGLKESAVIGDRPL
jgi:hypothetical protein